MNVTDGDARTARELLKAWVTGNPDVPPTPPRAQLALVQILAAALAEEREKARVRALLDFADYLDRGRDIPLVPSIFAEIARERAKESTE